MGPDPDESIGGCAVLILRFDAAQMAHDIVANVVSESLLALHPIIRATGSKARFYLHDVPGFRDVLSHLPAPHRSGQALFCYLDSFGHHVGQEPTEQAAIGHEDSFPPP